MARSADTQHGMLKLVPVARYGTERCGGGGGGGGATPAGVLEEGEREVGDDVAEVVSEAPAPHGVHHLPLKTQHRGHTAVLRRLRARR